MHAEQVLKSQFDIGITSSQLMHAEQVKKHNFIYHLQPNHAC